MESAKKDEQKVVQEQKTDAHVQKNTGNSTSVKSKKKKHKSVSNPSKYIRSAVAHVNRHSYRDTDFIHTGTNISYRDEDGVL